MVGRPEGRRRLGRPRRGCEDDIKMHLQEVEWGRMDYSDMAQDRERWRAVVNAAMNLRIPYNAENFLTNCKKLLASQEGLCSME